MNVWIVENMVDYEGGSVIGVVDSKEKGIELLKQDWRFKRMKLFRESEDSIEFYDDHCDWLRVVKWKVG